MNVTNIHKLEYVTRLCKRHAINERCKYHF